MAVVRTYPSPLLAAAAADHLAAKGIPASVAGRHGAFGGAMGYDVFTTGDADAARTVLSSFDTEPKHDLTSLYADALPDLSRLNPGTEAPCPACARQLPLSASLDSCPACGAPVDVIAVLVDRHGPELLSPCYPEPAEPIPEAILESVELACPGCKYSLRGLVQTGLCPECGTPYSKADLLWPPRPLF